LSTFVTLLSLICERLFDIRAGVSWFLVNIVPRQVGYSPLRLRVAAGQRDSPSECQRLAPAP